MIGTIEFDSATLYRYATVNVDELLRNLGDPEATVQAVDAFVRSFVTSMPTGKQNTFANRTSPDAVVVMIREDRPVNLVGAFEDPVNGIGGHVAESWSTACPLRSGRGQCVRLGSSRDMRHAGRGPD